MWMWLAAIVGVVLVLTLVVWAACSQMRESEEGGRDDDPARRAAIDRAFETYFFERAQRDTRQAGAAAATCPLCGWRHAWDVPCGLVSGRSS